MRSPITTARSLADYEAVTPDDQMAALYSAADDLGDVRVLHLNSTATGGGVAEILHSLVPLSNDLGIDTDWQVMDAEESFFEVTKAMHNALQGQEVTFTEEMEATYRRVTERNATALEAGYDVVVLHDPQTLGMARALKDRFPDTRIVWRCHIDLTDANERYLQAVVDDVRRVDHAVFSRPEYGRGVDVPTSIIHPSIDPLTDKNRPLDREEIAVERDRLFPIEFGDDSPVITQVSRFDPWKDQFGTIEMYRRIKDAVPGAQLVLAGGMADDDPEGREVYEEVVAATADDPDVHLLTNQPDTTIDFLQRESAVVVQKSLREGFGLVVSEALWKRTPVIGSTVGGIPLQIEDGKNGYLVDPDDVDGAAARLERLLADDDLRRQLGERGRETVRERFLLPRHLLDYAELFLRVRDGANDPNEPRASRADADRS